MRRTVPIDVKEEVLKDLAESAAGRNRIGIDKNGDSGSDARSSGSRKEEERNDGEGRGLKMSTRGAAAMISESCCKIYSRAVSSALIQGHVERETYRWSRKR